MKKRTLADINADILRKETAIDVYTKACGNLECEKTALVEEKMKFIAENYCISLRVRKNNLEIFIKSGLLGFISETGRAVILSDDGYRARFEEIHDIGWYNIHYDSNKVTWRDRQYWLSNDSDRLTLCSCETGRDSDVSTTDIFNFEDGVPCLNCDDPNIDR